MKKIIFLFCAFTICATIYAQTAASNLPAIDKSPMDMAYYPNNYPVLKIQDKASEPVIARVIYSRPQKNNRTVFGELIEYNTVWRMGANEATEITFAKDATFGGQAVKAGTYTLFTIPNENEWEVILNPELKQWGSYGYDKIKDKDLPHVKVPAKKLDQPVEKLTLRFDSQNALVIEWDQTQVTVPITAS